MIDSVSDSNVAAESSWPRLLGDIGGTNARFAWQQAHSSEITHVRVLPCADYPTLLDAIFQYLEQTGLEVPTWAAFGIANPVVSDQVSMTNHHWQFSVEQTRRKLNLQRLLVLNDFTALALALPDLPVHSKIQVGGGETLVNAPIALLGPGTGLGVSGLVRVPGTWSWVPIIGEGGHVTLSASTAEEFAVVSALQERFQHVSAERVLSGAGLVSLYQALAKVRDVASVPIESPSEIVALAQKDRDAFAREVLEMFFGFLGSVAGDLALTLGARGGLYVGGGIVPRVKERFLNSCFRERFESKGRFRSYLEAIPTWLIDAQISPALIGASRALSVT